MQGRDEREPERHQGGLFVYFHGHGSHPDSVDGYFREHHDDGWTRLCPVGSYPAENGFAWYQTGPRGTDWASLDRAADSVVLVIRMLCEELAMPTTNVVLGGFSQGAAFAVAISAALEEPTAGLLLQGGFLPESVDREIDLGAVRTGAVLVQVGRNDEVVPPFISHGLAAGFEHAGMATEVQEFDAGHCVDADMVVAAGDWLATRRRAVEAS